VDDLAVIVGLGNPGRRYEATRHNAGFLAASHLAGKAGIAWGPRRFEAITAMGRAAGRKVLIALPQTFMNRSGDAVAPLLGYFRRGPGDLIVLHDDVDLPLGCLKVKTGGGNGGHKGLDSIETRLGSREFARVRIGVGRPEREETDTADWVLSRFTPRELEELRTVLEDAAGAVETVLAEGVDAAMNRYNARS
jgi:peptidyl-tRNA hydrolase, PTH1 family